MCSETEDMLLDPDYEGGTISYEGSFDCEDTCAEATSAIVDNINVLTGKDF